MLPVLKHGPNTASRVRVVNAPHRRSYVQFNALGGGGFPAAIVGATRTGTDSKQPPAKMSKLL